MNNIRERIQILLNSEYKRPERDGAGVIIPNNVDSNIRRKAIQECLDIAKGDK